MKAQEKKYKSQLEEKEKTHQALLQSMKSEWDALKADWEKIALDFISKQKNLKETCREYEQLVQECLLKIRIQAERNSNLKRGLTSEYEKSNQDYLLRTASPVQNLEKMLLDHFAKQKDSNIDHLYFLNKAYTFCLDESNQTFGESSGTYERKDWSLPQRLDYLQDILLAKIKEIKSFKKQNSLPSMAQKIIAKGLAENAVLKGELIKRSREAVRNGRVDSSSSSMGGSKFWKSVQNRMMKKVPANEVANTMENAVDVLSSIKSELSLQTDSLHSDWNAALEVITAASAEQQKEMEKLRDENSAIQKELEQSKQEVFQFIGLLNCLEAIHALEPAKEASLLMRIKQVFHQTVDDHDTCMRLQKVDKM